MKHISKIFLAALFFTACTFTETVEFSGDLAFQKDPSGRVNGFTVANGRTKGISFDRYL